MSSSKKKNTRNTLSWWLEILCVGAVAVASHVLLLPVALGLLDADDATIAYTTHLFRSGVFSPFYPQQLYGGVVLTLIRAGWVASTETAGFPPLASQFSFTYLIVPMLLALGTYGLVKSFAQQRWTALIIGLTAAIGLEFWIVETLERDFYTAYVLLGMLLLALRFKVKDPWRDFGPRSWFLIATLSGFAFYTCRASAIYIVAFYWPIRWRELFRNPHFKSRCSQAGLGFILGTSPEWLYLLSQHEVAPLLVYKYSAWNKIRYAFSQLPTHLLSIVAPDLTWRAIPSGILGLGAFVALLRSKEPFRPTRIAFILGIVSYLLISQTAAGVARYLLPLSPLLMIGLGALWEQRSDSRWMRPLLTLLFLSHALLQLNQRYEVAHNPQLIERSEHIHEVVRWFQDQQVEIVISDEYWESNQYTFVSNRHPFFISDGRELALPEAFQEYKRAQRVGLILTRMPVKDGMVQIKQRTWAVGPATKQVGNLQLKVGVGAPKTEM